MTRLICPYDTGSPPCPIGPDDVICPVHLDDLVPASDPSDPADPQRRAEGRGPSAPLGHPTAAAANDTPDADRIACWRCQRTLPDAAHDACPSCKATQPGPTLALIFPTGTISLERGDRTRLGRAPDTPHAAILSAPNISKYHAVVWVDDDGTAWIKDTHSTNGTFLNGEETLPEVPCPLAGGTLRLGADNRARIHLRKRDR